MENKVVIEEDNMFYVCSSTMKETLTKKLLKKFQKKERKWTTFDEFVHWNYGVWAVRITESTCTCPFFLKQYQCEHLLGLKIRQHLVDVPPAARGVPMAQKRKRGRPSLAKRALIVQ